MLKQVKKYFALYKITFAVPILYLIIITFGFYYLGFVYGAMIATVQNVKNSGINSFYFVLPVTVVLCFIRLIIRFYFSLHLPASQVMPINKKDLINAEKLICGVCILIFTLQKIHGMFWENKLLLTPHSVTNYSVENAVLRQISLVSLICFIGLAYWIFSAYTQKCFMQSSKSKIKIKEIIVCLLLFTTINGFEWLFTYLINGSLVQTVIYAAVTIISEFVAYKVLP